MNYNNIVHFPFDGGGVHSFVYLILCLLCTIECMWIFAFVWLHMNILLSHSCLGFTILLDS